MEDMPVIPMFYYTNILVKQKDIKGIVKDVQGPIYFEWAYRE
jgi:oligopeptide transport system substrate-binding protein